MKTALINSAIPYNQKLTVSELVIGGIYSDIPFEDERTCLSPPVPLIFEGIIGTGAYFSTTVKTAYCKEPDSGLIGFPLNFFVYAY